MASRKQRNKQTGRMNFQMGGGNLGKCLSLGGHLNVKGVSGSSKNSHKKGLFSQLSTVRV